MAKIAVLASGSGSNFEALVRALAGSSHQVVLMVCDRKAAKVFERAERLGIPSKYLAYFKRDKAEVERELDEALAGAGVELVALAGFLRILSPDFVGHWKGRLLNVHPSPLPAYPGLEAIERMYEAGERVFGVTVHEVDGGMDTGPILAQRLLDRREGESLESLEARIHAIEHELYPSVILDFLARR